MDDEDDFYEVGVSQESNNKPEKVRKQISIYFKNEMVFDKTFYVKNNNKHLTKDGNSDKDNFS